MNGINFVPIKMNVFFKKRLENLNWNGIKWSLIFLYTACFVMVVLLFHSLICTYKYASRICI